MTKPRLAVHSIRTAPALLAVGVAALLTACATTKMDAQWSNPDFRGTKLAGKTVLVACQARDFTVQAVCEDQIARQLAAKGAKPIQFIAGNPGVQPVNDVVEAAARKANAPVVFRTTLSTSVPTVSPGPTIGIGVGGGSYGGGGGYGGGFGGISLPIGGGTVQEALAADSAIVDVASGKLMWSGRATGPSGSDTTAQLTELTRVMFEALQSTGAL